MEEGRIEERKKKKKVMVAIDESECSHYALHWALQNLQDSIANSVLVIFTAQPVVDSSYIYVASYGAVSQEMIRNVQENQKKVAVALLEKAKYICSTYGVSAETVTESGSPRDAICEAVEKFNIELLVLGSHGRGALKRAFLGSVSIDCVLNAKCPVLVVRKTV
ncbi:hypothetical protein LguiA_032448 [Lonicera macranthoides]